MPFQADPVFDELEVTSAGGGKVIITGSNFSLGADIELYDNAGHRSDILAINTSPTFHSFDLQTTGGPAGSAGPGLSMTVDDTTDNRTATLTAGSGAGTGVVNILADDTVLVEADFVVFAQAGGVGQVGFVFDAQGNLRGTGVHIATDSFTAPAAGFTVALTAGLNMILLQAVAFDGTNSAPCGCTYNRSTGVLTVTGATSGQQVGITAWYY